MTAQQTAEARIAELTAPKTSNRRKAPVVVVDGVVLMDQPNKANQMKRLAAASRVNLARVVPLKLKAMKLGGKNWRLVEAQGVPPMIEVLDVIGDDGDESALFDIYAGSGDWTDYYFIPA